MGQEDWYAIGKRLRNSLASSQQRLQGVRGAYGLPVSLTVQQETAGVVATERSDASATGKSL